MTVETTSSRVNRFTRAQIEIRLKSCARLPSLSTINSALRELLNADQRYTSQISEIIRRDPSLTSRLLRLVNSVYYGLTTPVNSIEEAVFYLGVRQIRQLAMVTPVIEDFQKLAGNTVFPWREFWQHCIGTAIMTREVVSVVMVPSDEADYVAGLVHDVGKIVMASAFPTQFAEVHRLIASGAADLLATETEVLGLDHAELGAIYLHNHNLPEVMVDVARYHHRSAEAKQNAPLVAAVQIADMLVRYAKIGTSGNPEPVAEEDPFSSKPWQMIFPNQDEEEISIARAALKRSLDRLPTILDGLV